MNKVFHLEFSLLNLENRFNKAEIVLITGVHFLGLDCRLRPDICGPNASCMNTHKKVTKDWKYHQCVCNPGFIGNGITCVDAANVANGNIYNFKSLYLFIYFFQGWRKGDVEGANAPSIFGKLNSLGQTFGRK